VFALKLNREKFAKKSTDLIRRKFSIDADMAALVLNASTISKPYPQARGNPLFTICVDRPSDGPPKTP
jgi:hypothetical protein